MTTFKVYQLAFDAADCLADAPVRPVDILDDCDEMDFYRETGNCFPLLHAIFKYGQNEFQPRETYSVSVGDVVEIDGNHWVVRPTGFKQLPPESLQDLLDTDCHSRCLGRLEPRS